MIYFCILMMLILSPQIILLILKSNKS
jgi:hypothetical protein